MHQTDVLLPARRFFLTAMNVPKHIVASLLLVFATISVSPVARVSAQPGVNVPVQAFYNELAPYGQWVQHPYYGTVWIPDAAPGFQPYATDGHWVVTEFGNTWVSDYPWGWAPFHYGRWIFDQQYGGWAWIPDSEWGPAWVSWRSGGGYYGWAPLGPGVDINVTVNIPAPYWTFVPQVYINSPQWYSYRVARPRGYAIYQNTVVINNVYRYNNRAYVYGPQRAEIERITRRPVTVYRIDRLDRPGRSVINGNSVGFYHPDGRYRNYDNDRYNGNRSGNYGYGNGRGYGNDPYGNNRPDNRAYPNGGYGNGNDKNGRPGNEGYNNNGGYNNGRGYGNDRPATGGYNNGYPNGRSGADAPPVGPANGGYNAPSPAPQPETTRPSYPSRGTYTPSTGNPDRGNYGGGRTDVGSQPQQPRNQGASTPGASTPGDYQPSRGRGGYQQPLSPAPNIDQSGPGANRAESPRMDAPRVETPRQEPQNPGNGSFNGGRESAPGQGGERGRRGPR